MSFIADDINNFKNQVYQLEQKWRSDRFTHTRRPYNADIIVSKRGTFKLEHAGGPLSKKLWSVLNQIQAQGLGTVAFDTWNPSQVLTTSTQNLELSYISNQQVIIETQGDPSSPIPSPATPLSTLPRKVDQILRSQVWFDRRQVELRHRLRSEAGLDSELPLPVDFYRPIVVDADLVGSNVPSLMRLSRLLIERGAAGIQLDDAQQTYSSILNQANIKVLYPVGQHINRLVALRAQSDIMDTETVVFTKLSSLQAGYVASNLDTRDHPYILGATVPTRPLAEVLREAQASGASTPDQLNFIRNSWMNNANVLTYRDAIAQAIRLKGGLTPGQISKEVEEWLENTRNTSLDHAKDLASQLGLEKVFWDWNLPRSQEGYYMYANTLEAAISRARHFAPYSDVVTLQSDAPDIGLADAFAVSLKKDHKNLLLGYSYPPLQSIDLTLNQYHAELANVVQQIADVGFAWQTLSLNPLNSNNVTKDPIAQQLFDSSIVAFASALRKKQSEKTGRPIEENLPVQQQYVQRLISSLGSQKFQEEPAISIVDKAAEDAQKEIYRDQITQLQDLQGLANPSFGLGNALKSSSKPSSASYGNKSLGLQNQGRFNALNTSNNASSGQFKTSNPLNFGAQGQLNFNPNLYSNANTTNPNFGQNTNDFNPNFSLNFSQFAPQNVQNQPNDLSGSGTNLSTISNWLNTSQPAGQNPTIHGQNSQNQNLNNFTNFQSTQNQGNQQQGFNNFSNPQGFSNGFNPTNSSAFGNSRGFNPQQQQQLPPNFGQPSNSFDINQNLGGGFNDVNSLFNAYATNLNIGQPKTSSGTIGNNNPFVPSSGISSFNNAGPAYPIQFQGQPGNNLPNFSSQPPQQLQQQLPGSGVLGGGPQHSGKIGPNH